MTPASTLTFAQSVLWTLELSGTLLTEANLRTFFRFLAEVDDNEVRECADVLEKDGLEPLFARMRQGSDAELGSPTAIGEIGTDLKAQVTQAMALLTSAQSSTSDYGHSLKAAGGHLAKGQEVADLKSIVSSLVAATTKMEQTAQEFETKLADSGRQIDRLNERLTVLQHQAAVDRLTEIANRRSFDERLENEVQAAAASKAELSLLLGDIDHFKQFNDAHGHQTGDQVLRFVAGAMSNNARDIDLVARYGGEEFAVLLPRTSLTTAVEVAERMRSTINGRSLVKRSTGERLGKVTMSIGAVQYRAGETAEEFVNRADSCLYEAKRSGRDLVVCETEVSAEGMRASA